MENSFLYKEIHEQPDVVENLLSTQLAAANRLTDAIQERGINHVLIAARGTSDNAGRYAKYVFGSINGLTVALAAPSLFSIYKTPPRLEGALVLGISQSGKSPDVAQVIAEAREQRCLTAALTNDSNSLLASKAEHVFDLSSGIEHAVAATKTYSAELAAIALISAVLSGEKSHIDDLLQMPDKIRKSLILAQNIPARVERYRYMERSVVIGRGFNYATAFELALKLKELSYTIVQPYSSADFKHGPMAILEQGFPVILIAPKGEMYHNIREFQSLLLERGAEVIAISNNEDVLENAHTPIVLPDDIPEWLTPIVSIVPGQIFSMALAHTRGFNVDSPRNIS